MILNNLIDFRFGVSVIMIGNNNTSKVFLKYYQLCVMKHIKFSEKKINVVMFFFLWWWLVTFSWDMRACGQLQNFITKISKVFFTAKLWILASNLHPFLKFFCLVCFQIWCLYYKVLWCSESQDNLTFKPNQLGHANST